MDTKETILNAAQALMQSRGANGMSYEDVSQAVGIRKASIHYHFASKADLIEAVLERYAVRFDEAVAQICATGESGARQLRSFTDIFRQTLAAGEGTICLCGMLASEVGTLDQASQERVRRFFDRGTEGLKQILEHGVADGSLRLTDLPTQVAGMLFAALEGALLTARLDGSLVRFDALVEPLLKLLKTPNH